MLSIHIGYIAYYCTFRDFLHYNIAKLDSHSV